MNTYRVEFQSLGESLTIKADHFWQSEEGSPIVLFMNNVGQPDSGEREGVGIVFLAPGDYIQRVQTEGECECTHSEQDTSGQDPDSTCNS